MKRTSKKRRPPRLTLQRAIRTLWIFPFELLAAFLDLLVTPMFWLVLVATWVFVAAIVAVSSLIR
jgi:hypothetical protein